MRGRADRSVCCASLSRILQKEPILSQAMAFLANLHGIRWNGINFHGVAINSKQISTGIAVGIGATALLGGCYILHASRNKKTNMIQGRTMGDGQWQTSMATDSFRSNFGGGDHERIGRTSDPPVFPYISPDNRTWLAVYLQEDIYDQLCCLKTSFGSSLDECIQVGVDNPQGDIFSDSFGLDTKSCGFVAPDAECYVIFEKLFAPIIHSRHQLLVVPAIICNPVNSRSFKISAIEVRVHRNLATVPFAPRISRVQRRFVFNTVAEMCEKVEPGINIYLLSDVLSEKETDKLRRLNLFKDIVMDNPYRISIGQYRDPLDARAIALSHDEATAIIINSLDHLVIVGREESGSVELAYRMVKEILDQCEAWLRVKGFKFAYNDKFGYLTVLPELVGSATTVKCRLSFADRHGGAMFASKARMILADMGLSVLKEIDESESSGWLHYDVETAETFIKGQDGFGVQATIAYFSAALMKIQEKLKL